jgi:mRNA export factor
MDPFVGLNRMAPDWNPNGDLEILPSPDDSISSISWHPTDNYIAAGSWDKQVRLWQIHGGVAQPKAAIAHEAPVLNVSFLSDGSKIFSAGCDCQVLCWDLASNKTMQVAKVCPQKNFRLNSSAR